MTKHDTWVCLFPNSPLENYLHLFPNGIPMGDPFAMEQVRNQTGGFIPVWIVDLDRKSPSQFKAIAKAIASSFPVDAEAVATEDRANGGFAVNCDWIASIRCGPEAAQRMKELTNFLNTALQPPSAKAWREFFASQRRRWSDGDEVPPPLPTNTKELGLILITLGAKAAPKD
ncbi:hypothetical protein [Microseira sp. BLCC-F43]|jgi:hypothetical protein|uniref:hypothetical protein n=1 Tax=Microseira sp. BLCC-F43 TaxID=3153602 RepID=UPI0035B6CB45